MARRLPMAKSSYYAVSTVSGNTFMDMASELRFHLYQSLVLSDALTINMICCLWPYARLPMAKSGAVHGSKCVSLLACSTNRSLPMASKEVSAVTNAPRSYKCLVYVPLSTVLALWHEGCPRQKVKSCVWSQTCVSFLWQKGCLWQIWFKVY